MDKKILLFIGLSLLMVLVGVPLTLKQNWIHYKNANQKNQMLTDSLSNVTMFNEYGDISLKHFVADSSYFMFRFPPHTCSCLEADFVVAINNFISEIGDSRIFVLIAAESIKEFIQFCERAKLSCPVYATIDTFNVLFDIQQIPYVCLVSSDLIAHSIVRVHPGTINEFISYAKKNIP